MCTVLWRCIDFVTEPTVVREIKQDVMGGAEGGTIICHLCCVCLCVCVSSPVHDCLRCRCSYARDLHPPVHCCASRGRPSRSKSRTHLHGTYPQCTTPQRPLTHHAPHHNTTHQGSVTARRYFTHNAPHCSAAYPRCTTPQRYSLVRGRERFQNA